MMFKERVLNTTAISMSCSAVLYLLADVS